MSAFSLKLLEVEIIFFCPCRKMPKISLFLQGQSEKLSNPRFAYESEH